MQLTSNEDNILSIDDFTRRIRHNIDGSFFNQ